MDSETMRLYAKVFLGCAAVIFILSWLTGCSSFSIKTTLPDGTVIEAKHRNFLQDRKLTGESPDGFKFSSEVSNDAPTVIINNAVDKAAPIAKAAAGM